jgi:hypothetical protein
MRNLEVHSRFASYALRLAAHVLRAFSLRAFAHLRAFVLQTFRVFVIQTLTVL